MRFCYDKKTTARAYGGIKEIYHSKYFLAMAGAAVLYHNHGDGRLALSNSLGRLHILV